MPINKDQEERSRAVDAFRQGIKDVLVATDVASKGLDFTNIQHVINYDMPDDIENYGMFKEFMEAAKRSIVNSLVFLLVHRIGRTGRSSNKGLATTFINKSNEESVLLDLKHLLIEAKQDVPPFLATLQSETEVFQDLGGNKNRFILLFRFYSIAFFCFDRRQRLQLLWWTWSSYYSVPETGSRKQQTSFCCWSERLFVLFSC